MKGFIDTLLFLKEIDTEVGQLDENLINKLKDIRGLVSDKLKTIYKPSDIVLNYIDLLLKADEANNMNKRSELNSKLKPSILLLSIWKVLLEGDIL